MTRPSIGAATSSSSSSSSSSSLPVEEVYRKLMTTKYPTVLPRLFPLSFLQARDSYFQRQMSQPPTKSPRKKTRSSSSSSLSFSSKGDLKSTLFSMLDDRVSSNSGGKSDEEDMDLESKRSSSKEKWFTKRLKDMLQRERLDETHEEMQAMSRHMKRAIVVFDLLLSLEMALPLSKTVSEKVQTSFYPLLLFKSLQPQQTLGQYVASYFRENSKPSFSTEKKRNQKRVSNAGATQVDHGDSDTFKDSEDIDGVRDNQASPEATDEEDVELVQGTPQSKGTKRQQTTKTTTPSKKRYKVNDDVVDSQDVTKGLEVCMGCKVLSRTRIKVLEEKINSGQIGSSESVETLKKQVETLKKEVKDLRKWKTDHNAKMSSLEDKLGELEKMNETVLKKVSDLHSLLN